MAELCVLSAGHDGDHLWLRGETGSCGAPFSWDDHVSVQGDAEGTSSLTWTNLGQSPGQSPTRRVTYRNADRTAVWGEYDWVDSTEFWDDCDELVPVVKETWSLVASETIQLPERYVQDPDGPCIWCGEDRDGGAAVGCIAPWHTD